MKKQDIVTQVVSSVCNSKPILDSLRQIEDKRRESLEIVIRLGIKKRTLKQKNHLLDLKVLDSLVGVIGYGIQGRTGIDFGYCDEKCMSGSSDMDEKFMCDHIGATCEYIPLEENLGSRVGEIESDYEDNGLEFVEALDARFGNVRGEILTDEDLPVSMHNTAVFFAKYGQDL